MGIGKTVVLPEPTRDYLNEIESSWNDHFEQTKKETRSYFKDRFATYLKSQKDGLVSNNEK